jgi:hypothetical protein
MPADALRTWTEVVPSVFCASALTTPAVAVVVAVVVAVAGSLLTDSTAGIVMEALSAFEEADSCSASALGVESALLLALGVPSEVASAGRA